MSAASYLDVGASDLVDVDVERDGGEAGHDLFPPPPGMCRRAAALRNQLIDAALERAWAPRPPGAIPELARRLLAEAEPEALSAVVAEIEARAGPARVGEVRGLLRGEGLPV